MKQSQAKPKTKLKVTPAKAAEKKPSRKNAGKKTLTKKEAEKKPKQPELQEQAKVKLVSTEELAKFVGVDVRWIQKLTQDGVIKKEPGTKRTAKYDFVRTVHALLQFYRQKADNRKSGNSEDMEVEKMKQVTVKRKLEELKLAQLEGELHKAEDIERIIGAMLTRLRINLLAIPMGLAPILREINDVREIAEKMDGRIRRALNEVANLSLQKLIEEERFAAQET